MMTLHPDMLSIPYEEYLEFMKKMHPQEDAKKLWIASGGKIDKKKKEEE